MGHVLMENRNGLVVEHRLSISSGTAEPEAAVEMVSSIPGTHRITVGMDKGYDRANCVREMRQLRATPHVAQRKVSSAIDQRTARHPGYEVSQRLRKRVDYSASKAAIIALTMSLAKSAGPFGITVNAVAPGFIRTEMTKGFGHFDPATVPLRRIGAPEDVADVIVFLASRRARYVTGETIDVNGGVYMT